MNDSVFLIGAGNLAFHLGQQLREKGYDIRGIFSRTIEKASGLGNKLGAPYCSRMEDIDESADIYMLAIADSAIAKVARALQQQGIKDKLVVHTSGATPSTVLLPFFDRYGVFYPLQTFSKDRAVDFSKVPLCIQAASPDDEAKLLRLARQLSRSVFRVDDQGRAVLHVAAVFVNNFTNHLFSIGCDIATRNGLSFDLLRPLIEETAAKVQGNYPAAMQTGPAIRGDRDTIERHLRFLEKDKDHLLIYQVLTESINPDLK